MPISLEVWGDYALFTRPEMKVERVSYDAVSYTHLDVYKRQSTPSALHTATRSLSQAEMISAICGVIPSM